MASTVVKFARFLHRLLHYFLCEFDERVGDDNGE